MSRAAKIVRTLALLVAAAQLGVLAWLFARRLTYSYDLEWMEGGMLCHAQRILDGKPVYAPPSLDFIPYLYTPLYPALLAALAKLTGGIGYLSARVVSVGGFLGALWLGGRFALRAGGSRAAAFAAMALPAAAFATTGAWYDLARPDSLWLFLVTAALLVLYSAARIPEGEARRGGPRSHAFTALAALLMVAAFLCKQTASPFLIAGGVALLALDWRLVPTYVVVLAVAGLGSLWWLNHTSDGWFWTYVFKLHQSHLFYAKRAFVETPLHLAVLDGPALIVVPWALWRRRSPAVIYAAFLGACGVAVACVSFGTQWAFDNAFIPGVFFPALAMGAAGGALVSSRKGELTPRLRPVVVYALLAASLALHPFDPRRFVPTARDRAAGKSLVERLRAAPGEVLIPFHPFYAQLAGKRTFLHRMGVMDIQAAGLWPPRGLAEATRAHRFALAVFDDRIDGNWFLWPEMQREYRVNERIGGPHTVSGAPTVPTYVLVPNDRAP